MSDVAAPPRELKMWCALRQDLGLTIGKAAGTIGHAYQWHAVKAMQAADPVFLEYVRSGVAEGKGTPKITVRARSLEHLLKIEAAARQDGLNPVLVRDEGRTELPPDTPTCVVFGPAYRDDLSNVLSKLQIFTDPVARA